MPTIRQLQKLAKSKVKRRDLEGLRPAVRKQLEAEEAKKTAEEAVSVALVKTQARKPRRKRSSLLRPKLKIISRPL
jgi:hypothetical protein